MKCANTLDDLALFKLLHIVSPTLPVGAFSYSQTLEWWVEKGLINNESSFIDWLKDMTLYSQFKGDLCFFTEAYQCVSTGDFKSLFDVNSLFLSSRESSELRAETVQMGYSLLKLIPEITQTNLDELTCAQQSFGYPIAWALLSFHAGVSLHIAKKGFLWSWLENLVMVGVKVIPLGQTAGQRVLVTMVDFLSSHCETEVFHNTFSPITVLPGLAIASANHETQYTRLFRS